MYIINSERCFLIHKRSIITYDSLIKTIDENMNGHMRLRRFIFVSFDTLKFANF